MQRIIRIGSRESRLAVAQAEFIKKQIEKCHPQLQVELVTMKTTGDKIVDRSLENIGGKGLFVKELDQALADGIIDLAVHSLKDMPMEQNEEFPILACSEREDARDVLVYRPGRDTFPGDGVVGTSSRRRAIQMRKLYPQARFRNIRGNVQTRLKKLSEEDYDATILAAAGLKRLGMESYIGRIFDTEEMIPAAGQGILAVQGRKDENAVWLDDIRNQQSEWAALAERQFVRTLDGGCTSPVAAHAKIRGNEICLRGLYFEEGSEDYFTDSVIGDVEQAQKLGETLAIKMKKESRLI